MKIKITILLSLFVLSNLNLVSQNELKKTSPLEKLSEESLTKNKILDEGIDTLATINSFEGLEDFYKMEYVGDYNELLDLMDDQMTGKKYSDFEPFECSLFSANGEIDNQLFGRNFDNPENDVLIARYNPPDGYSSLAFTRMSDLGFTYGTNYNNLTFNQKIPLLMSAYFVPDGINEHGISAGLATINSVNVIIDPSKDTIFITRLIREILDHAQNVEEALDVANSYNVFDQNIYTITHHVLVGSPNGESIVLEYVDGEFHAITNQEPWQVATNIPIYNVPLHQLMSNCWRFSSLYTFLKNNNGSITWEEGMDALNQVHLNCPWSAIYDMTNRGIYIVFHNNFEDITYVDLENFNFIVYVNIDTNFEDNSKYKLEQNIPNPFNSHTTIYFELAEKTDISLTIFDNTGKVVKTLLNEEKEAGRYSIIWDGTNDKNKNVETGIYFYQIKTGNKFSETKKMLFLKKL
jgi:hypothetical protein